MSAVGFQAAVSEVRGLARAIRDELEPARVGRVVVSGLLAEQLAKELGRGAEPGAVAVAGDAVPEETEVLVRVIAGEPSPADDALIRGADRNGVPTVVVQLWPQAEWTRPFVLTPYVVECQAGHGFPLREIADRIVETTENGSRLASRLPELRDAAERDILRCAVVRSTLLGLLGARAGPTRTLITVDQIRMLGRLDTAAGGRAAAAGPRALAGGAAVAAAAGFSFRRLARETRSHLPARVADAAVAAVGTWLLARAAHELRVRLPGE